jgi:hypothetical protein
MKFDEYDVGTRMKAVCMVLVEGGGDSDSKSLVDV